MPFNLIPEEEMASRSKKEKISIKKEVKKTDEKENIVKEKSGISLISKEQVEKLEEEKAKEEKKKLEEEKTKEEKKKLEEEKEKVKEKGEAIKKTIPPTSPNIIVKRIYFPGGLYSKKENQKEFKKIIAGYGLTWYKPMMKSYVNKEGIKILSGMYVSSDQTKKVLCIYEGTDKPMTAIVKVVGTGGNFLIDLGSFAHKIGCEVEDKDEMFINNTLLTLQEKGEIYKEKKIEETNIEDYQKILEEKIQKYVEEALQRYIDANKESFERRGISIETVKFFMRKEVEEDVRWGVEHGFVKL